MEENKKAVVKTARVLAGVYEIGIMFACATLGAAIGDVAGSKLATKLLNK